MKDALVGVVYRRFQIKEIWSSGDEVMCGKA